jgi:hypothetical protein
MFPCLDGQACVDDELAALCARLLLTPVTKAIFRILGGYAVLIG